MQSITLTKSGAGSSTVRAIDFFQNPVNIGLGVAVTGSATYTVEFTFSDPSNADFDASTAVWFAVSDLSAQTANKAAILSVPCRGVRITNAAGTTGSTTLYIQQAGTR